jgi:hypothetical protein
MATGDDKCRPLLTNHKFPWMNRAAHLKHNAITRPTKLITSLHSKHHKPLNILIHLQNSYAPRSRRCTGRRVPVNKGKDFPVVWVNEQYCFWKEKYLRVYALRHWPCRELDAPSRHSTEKDGTNTRRILVHSQDSNLTPTNVSQK